MTDPQILAKENTKVRKEVLSKELGTVRADSETKDAPASDVEALVMPLKAYICEPPFERYDSIVKYAETASKARYQCLLDLREVGFRKSHVEIMDIKVRREKKFDAFKDELENMGWHEAYRKYLRLEAV